MSSTGALQSLISFFVSRQSESSNDKTSPESEDSPENANLKSRDTDYKTDESFDPRLRVDDQNVGRYSESNHTSHVNRLELNENQINLTPGIIKNPKTNSPGSHPRELTSLTDTLLLRRANLSSVFQSAIPDVTSFLAPRPHSQPPIQISPSTTSTPSPSADSQNTSNRYTAKNTYGYISKTQPESLSSSPPSHVSHSSPPSHVSHSSHVSPPSSGSMSGTQVNTPDPAKSRVINSTSPSVFYEDNRKLSFWSSISDEVDELKASSSEIIARASEEMHTSSSSNYDNFTGYNNTAASKKLSPETVNIPISRSATSPISPLSPLSHPNPSAKSNFSYSASSAALADSIYKSMLTITPYNKFLNRLKMPECLPVVKDIKIFVDKFRSFHSKAQSQQLQKLIEDSSKKLCGVPSFQNYESVAGEDGTYFHPQSENAEATDDLLEIQEGIEKFVLSKVFKSIFPDLIQTHEEEEEVVSKNILFLMHWLDLTHLEVPLLSGYEAAELLWVSNVQLRRLQTCRCPLEKLECIINCCRMITLTLRHADTSSTIVKPASINILNNESVSWNKTKTFHSSPNHDPPTSPIPVVIPHHNVMSRPITDKMESEAHSSSHSIRVNRPDSTPAGADVYLSLLIWIIVKCSPENIIANLEYISHYRNASKLVSEYLYYFTQFYSAVHFIRAIDDKKLNVDARLYGRYWSKFRNYNVRNSVQNSLIDSRNNLSTDRQFARIYKSFLSDLKSPECVPIVAEAWRYVQSLPNELFYFKDAMHNLSVITYSTENIFKKMGLSSYCDAKTLKQCVHKYIFAAAYRFVFPMDERSDASQSDFTIDANIAEFQKKIRPSHVLKSSCQMVTLNTLEDVCGDVLQCLQNYKSPLEKLDCLVSCCRMIALTQHHAKSTNEFLEAENEKFKKIVSKDLSNSPVDSCSGDLNSDSVNNVSVDDKSKEIILKDIQQIEFLGALIWVIIARRPKHLYSTSKFVTYGRLAKQISETDNCFIKQFQKAVRILMNARDTQSLRAELRKVKY